VQLAVQELQRLMWAQYRMAALPEDVLSALPRSLITAELKPSPLAQLAGTWAHRGVLCRLEDSATGGARRLQIRLSLAHPVPAPLGGPNTAAAGI
jgi:hypothetical protein